MTVVAEFRGGPAEGRTYEIDSAAAEYRFPYLARQPRLVAGADLETQILPQSLVYRRRFVGDGFAVYDFEKVA